MQAKKPKLFFNAIKSNYYHYYYYFYDNFFVYEVSVIVDSSLKYIASMVLYCCYIALTPSSIDVGATDGNQLTKHTKLFILH